MTKTMTVLVPIEELNEAVAEWLAWRDDLEIIDIDLGIPVTEKGAVEIDVEVEDE